MDKFCLKWDEFGRNNREYFRKLREDQGLSDVTLATDDGQHIKAHKIILCAGSHFFSDIFMKSDQNNLNMIIYLKGISKTDLEPIIDFIYNGETFIAQEVIKGFIETGKDLKVKGLEGEITGIEENESKASQDNIHNGSEHQNIEGESDQEFTTDSSSLVDTFNTQDILMTKGKDKSLQIYANTDLDTQLQEIVEKNEGVWRCKICGKISKTNQNIKKHAETHVEGNPHICNICNKTYSNRPSLQKHISVIHSELFSCEACEAHGMTRRSLTEHKRRLH